MADFFSKFCCCMLPFERYGKWSEDEAKQAGRIIAMWIMFSLSIFFGGFFIKIVWCEIEGHRITSSECTILKYPVGISADPMQSFLGAIVLFIIYLMYSLCRFICTKRNGTHQLAKNDNGYQSLIQKGNGEYEIPSKSKVLSTEDDEGNIVVELEEFKNPDTGEIEHYTRNSKGELIRYNIESTDTIIEVDNLTSRNSRIHNSKNNVPSKISDVYQKRE